METLGFLLVALAIVTLAFATMGWLGIFVLIVSFIGYLLIVNGR